MIESDDRYLNVDMIATPSINYFKNINSVLLKKSKFLFYFFDENLIDMFNPKDNYNSRTSKILLSGKINFYHILLENKCIQTILIIKIFLIGWNIQVIII